MELFEKASEEMGEILDLLDQLSNAMDNVLLHHRHQMPVSDVSTRFRLASQAQSLLARIGYYKED